MAFSSEVPFGDRGIGMGVLKYVSENWELCFGVWMNKWKVWFGRKEDLVALKLKCLSGEVLYLCMYKKKSLDILIRRAEEKECYTHPNSCHTVAAKGFCPYTTVLS